MERNFALGSIITGAVVIMGILFCRLFSGLYRGWDIFMMLDPLFFYTLLIMAGVSFLKNRDFIAGNLETEYNKNSEDLHL